MYILYIYIHAQALVCKVVYCMSMPGLPDMLNPTSFGQQRILTDPDMLRVKFLGGCAFVSLMMEQCFLIGPPSIMDMLYYPHIYIYNTLQMLLLISIVSFV